MHKSKHSTLMEVTVPQGWKLVPIEPTDEMLLAGYSDFHNTEIWWSLMLDAAPAAPVATPAPAFSVGVRGVGLIDDNPSALAIYFYAAPNNDDIRALHEVVSGPPAAAQAQPTRRELDMAMLIKNLARQVRRAEPYGTNYHRISDDALDALKRWGLDCSPVRTTKPEGTQSQQVDKSTEMQRQLVHRTPDLHCQQQPVSGADGVQYHDEPWRGWACQYPGKMPRLYGAKEIATANHHPEEGDRLIFLAEQAPLSGNSGELNFQAEYEAFKDAAWNKSGSPIGLMDGKNAAWWAWVNRAALAQQDAEKVDAALAEMIHAMFRSGNSVPVTRITIDRKQYEAAIDAARKEPDQ